MKRMLAMAAAALLGAPALAAAQAPAMKRWLVTFDPRVKEAGRVGTLSAMNLAPLRHIATDGNSAYEFSAAVVELPEGERPEPVTAMGEALPQILSIEEDVRTKWIESALPALPTLEAVRAALPVPQIGGRTPAAALQLAAARPEITWGVNRVRAPGAWDTTEGANVRVAVIDTGIDFRHPELLGKVDGGYSAITGTEREADYKDDQGHGTHVAGTIAAVRDGRGVVGVAPRARLYAVKVLDREGSGTLSNVVDGIVWAARNGMQVANMSLGARIGSPAMQSAVRFARGRGMVIVAAAGNSGPPAPPATTSVSYPGAYPDVIAVAASDDEDRIADFSSRGPEVDFIAPGKDIVSARSRHEGGDYYTSMSGTSMAAPHVAGLAALAVSQGYVGLNGPDGVFQKLREAARRVPGLGDTDQGAGMISAEALVR